MFQTKDLAKDSTRNRYLKSPTVAFSSHEDNFLSLNTVSAPMRMQCNGARVWRTMNPLYSSLGRVEISFWLFCFLYSWHPGAPRWSHRRVKYDKARADERTSERDASSIHGRWSRRSCRAAVARENQIESISLTRHNTRRGSIYDTIQWNRTRAVSPCLSTNGAPSGYILRSRFFPSSFFACPRRWVMVSRSIAKSKTYSSYKITTIERENPSRVRRFERNSNS